MTMGPKTGISGVETLLGEAPLTSRIRAGRAICWMCFPEAFGKTNGGHANRQSLRKRTQMGQRFQLRMLSTQQPCPFGCAINIT